MFEVTSTQSLPYSAICYVRCDWPDGSATRASAVVVGVNDVLTALHVVYDTARGGWATHITITPGTDTSPFFNAPFGSFSDVGSVVGRAANWDLNGDGLLTAQESQGDLALIGTDSAIGNVTGWLPIADLPSTFSGEIAGYPVRGTGLMAEFDAASASPDYGVYDIASGLGPGASGGPLLYSAGGVTSVVGVLSSGTLDETASTYAGLFGAGTWDWLRSAMAANDSLLGLPAGSAPQSSPSIFLGTAAADSYTGTAGNDVFTGLGGNDTFNGLDGTDTAVFSGTRATHNVTVMGAGEIVVSDAVAGRDGTDTLSGVERLRFDDVSLAFDVNGAAGEAYRLYQAAFDRQPDLPGLGYQMNALETGLTLEQVAANFLASPEFQRTYGMPGDGDFVTQLYANVLHRAPDAAGLQYHLQELASGQSRALVLTHFSESPENQADVIGAISGGIAYVPV